jgi:hypothetical protein
MMPPASSSSLRSFIISRPARSSANTNAPRKQQRTPNLYTPARHKHTRAGGWLYYVLNFLHGPFASRTRCQIGPIKPFEWDQCVLCASRSEFPSASGQRFYCACLFIGGGLITLAVALTVMATAEFSLVYLSITNGRKCGSCFGGW